MLLVNTPEIWETKVAHFSIPNFRRVLLAKQVPGGVVHAWRGSWGTGWYSCGNSAMNCLLNWQYGQISSRNHWDFSMELLIFIVPFSWAMTGNLNSICDVHWQLLLFFLGKGDFLKFLFWKLELYEFALMPAPKELDVRYLLPSLLFSPL